jgi:hypothetical protein
VQLFDYPQNEICDVVFLTNTSDTTTYEMTLHAISSLRQSEIKNKFRIILVESNQNNYFKYPVDVQLAFKGQFNYNKALNMAFELLQNDFVYVSNNDVLFYPNFYSQLRYYMDIFDLDSASPRCPEVQYGINPVATQEILSYPEHVIVRGYRSVVHFCGWGWLMKRQILELLLPLSEEFEFWAQDDDIALSLQKFNKKHALITASEVKHFGQKSYEQIKQEDRYRMTFGCIDKLKQKWI